MHLITYNNINKPKKKQKKKKLKKNNLGNSTAICNFFKIF